METYKIVINNLNTNPIAPCEAHGLAKVFQAYAERATGEGIIDEGIGFNKNSGIIYIALENGITICSAFGGDVEYLVADFETGDEEFFEFYSDALTSIEQ